MGIDDLIPPLQAHSLTGIEESLSYPLPSRTLALSGNYWKGFCFCESRHESDRHGRRESLTSGLWAIGTMTAVCWGEFHPMSSSNGKPPGVELDLGNFLCPTSCAGLEAIMDSPSIYKEFYHSQRLRITSAVSGEVGIGPNSGIVLEQTRQLCSNQAYNV
ncbi:hypothetical protein H6P81_014729 [Aristolochia fimbriata]|uniref:Uncharacterized protein n=1 Tax=Aristolochia fimbriata TaxID=158543 RepID=A0AAV7E3J3_ARIFI|nr:hypothetical protein H6P81_014729 [Aristolochia fimbriata]